MSTADLPAGKTTTLAYDHNFATVESVEGNRVELSYGLNAERRPWLSLPPQHPVLLEKYQYFSSITTSWAAGLFSPATYSALTKYSWHCPALYGHCGYGTRGICVNRHAGDSDIMDIDIYSDAGEHLVHMECAGFAFEDRDFRTWRKASRQKALAEGGETDIDYVVPERAGLGTGGKSLISDLREEDGQPSVTALVTSENGFYPGHPFHTGSGDHVNVGHYLDCVQQMTCLLFGESQTPECIGGQAGFNRFIELDVPFEISLITQTPSAMGDIKLSFRLSQLGKENAIISLLFNNTEQ